MTSISFCIPTRNFGAFIEETLRAIEQQCGADDEIVVVDGASTDDTTSIVGTLANQFGNIAFRRQETNGGVDRDLALAVSLATREFCWLFSADDVPIVGAVQRVRSALAERPEVCLLNRVECDAALRPQRSRQWLRVDTDEITAFRTGSTAGLLKYFSQARSIGAAFSYISSIVVRRDVWNQTTPRGSLWGTNYAHVGRLLDILSQPESRVIYLPRPSVLCRGDNDSFAARGPVRRVLLDMEGYSRIAAEVFVDRPVLRTALHAVLRRSHRLRSLVLLRSRVKSASEWREAVALLIRVQYPPSHIRFADIVGRFPLFVGLLYAVYRFVGRLVERGVGFADRHARPRLP